MRGLLLAAVLLLAGTTAMAQDDDPALVLTSLAPVYQATRSLLAGTPIEVQNIPASPRSMASQPTLLMRQGERFREQFERAEAVVTAGKIWTGDPLYTTARQFNIHIVDIDASKPWSYELSGVAVSTFPSSGDVSPYFWTSPSNIIRMLDIIGRDLQILFPGQASIINDNLNAEKAALVDLKARFENRFIEVADPVVYALTDEFTYLTSDLGIFVEDYFVKQDIDWTQADLANLTQTLKDSNIRIVLHKWEPSEQISAAIAGAGARLLVLDTMETGQAPLQVLLQANLDALLDAFQ